MPGLGVTTLTLVVSWPAPSVTRSIGPPEVNAPPLSGTTIS
jgi:hypothetical protein